MRSLTKKRLNMNQKDIKLLWGRSGNRCAICRCELSQDKKSATASFTLGEQAHITGEKEDAPRGKSLLTEEERNSYHNLILLCPNDHTLIDRNEVDWPVEKLHYMKSRHELWVRETLGDSADSKLIAKQIVVTSIIDAAVELCKLEEWKIWTSYALAPSPRWSLDLPGMIFEFWQRPAAAIWPEEYEELKRSTITLAELLYRAASKFIENAECLEGSYIPDKFYKPVGGCSPDYYRDISLYNEWLQECWNLVYQATSAVNWFADVVRRDINPMFFADRGKFSILEGPFSDGAYYSSIPEYSEDEKRKLPDCLFLKVEEDNQSDAEEK